MKSEREREAKEFRATGEEEAQKIRADAEKTRTVIVAEAKKQAQQVRGEGDSDAIRIYAIVLDAILNSSLSTALWKPTGSQSVSLAHQWCCRLIQHFSVISRIKTGPNK
ncbi:MAG: hypothetical protein CM15mP80_03780 [Alphaproteobacteria bacterium]|nr:MAG: hypothetical protein CM15mP80_03780 [Alphaproteobacteria bacterium]